MSTENEVTPDQGETCLADSKDIYNAYRDLVKHEDGLRNERLKTLFTIQGILFGALGFTWKDNSLLLVFPIFLFGVFVAIYYHHDLKNGGKALDEILDEWHSLSASATGKPRLIGRSERALKSPSWIVGALVLLWIAILLAAFARFLLL